LICGLFLFCRFILVRVSFFESLAENSQALTTDGAKEAEVAHFDEAFGQHMGGKEHRWQETVDEFFDRARISWRGLSRVTENPA
jgi:hypothetical protein